METTPTETNQGSQQRAQVYWTLAMVMICCSVGSVCGRILNIQSEYNGEPAAFYSANDRSRWCTVRALVDHNTYAIDQVIEGERPWNTIDKVRHVGADGEFHFYSSKPPVLPTIAAGGYWVLKTVTGKSIAEHPFFIIRTLLILINGTSLFVALIMLAKIAHSLTARPGPALFVVATGCFGTYLTSFGTTFSNHVPAAACVMIVIALFVPYWLRQAGDQRNFKRFLQFVAMGVFSALAVACDLPALAFGAAMMCFCLLRCWSSTLIGFLPGAGLVAAAFFGTNYLAHDTWKLAYAHRSDGTVVETVEGDFAEILDSGKLPEPLKTEIDKNGLSVSVAANVTPGYWPHSHRNRWTVDFGKQSQLAIVQIDDQKYEIRKWNNWYDYPGSYWATNNEKKSPVDRGVANQQEYLMHITVGHHGVISLSPVLLLGWIGLLIVAFTNRQSFGLPALAFLAITVVVFTFYVYRPQHDRNFGGWTSCFRWAIWMYPMWLTAMVPLVEMIWSRRWLRWLAVTLLFVSATSAAYAFANPWTKPWIEEFFFKNQM